MNKALFITGIGTGIGKTLVSAVLVEHLKADYWKPVQAGDLDNSDSHSIALMTAGKYTIHPEKYRLGLAASPHEAADVEGIDIRLHDFQLPETENRLLVEGAGGLMVPLNQQDLMVDLIQHLKTPVILVIRDYLGCINHSLLSIRLLAERDIALALVIFNGHFKPATRSIIVKHLPKNIEVADLPEMAEPDLRSVAKAAKNMKPIRI